MPNEDKPTRASIPGSLGTVRVFGIPVRLHFTFILLLVFLLFIGIGGLAYRTVQLFFIKDVQTGLVWMVKILTDPFHDIKLYYKAPLYLLHGELFDTMPPEQHV